MMLSNSNQSNDNFAPLYAKYQKITEKQHSADGLLNSMSKEKICLNCFLKAKQSLVNEEKLQQIVVSCEQKYQEVEKETIMLINNITSLKGILFQITDYAAKNSQKNNLELKELLEFTPDISSTLLINKQKLNHLQEQQKSLLKEKKLAQHQLAQSKDTHPQTNQQAFEKNSVVWLDEIHYDDETTTTIGDNLIKNLKSCLENNNITKLNIAKNKLIEEMPFFSAKQQDKAKDMLKTYYNLVNKPE